MTRTLPPPFELLGAYAHGYFPMPNPDSEEIFWYRPDPRAILPLDGFHCSRSLKKTITRNEYQVTFNQNFEDVMSGCASRKETWINSEFKRAYRELHQLGYAHSVETWKNGHLVGGVYGVQLGGAFFAESMYSEQTNASKVALYHLVSHLKQHHFALLETQFLTPHLESLGVVEISDLEYQELLRKALSLPCRF